MGCTASTPSAGDVEKARLAAEAMPLVTAAQNNDEEAVKALLAAGYKYLEEKDEFGNTPLILAAREGSDFSVKALLAAGANKEAKDVVSDGYACDDPLMADDPSHGLRVD